MLHSFVSPECGIISLERVYVRSAEACLSVNRYAAWIALSVYSVVSDWVAVCCLMESV